MRPERQIELPSRREDGSFRYPVQVVIQTHGKWDGFGYAKFETVGYTSDIAHLRRLTECLR